MHDLQYVGSSFHSICCSTYLPFPEAVRQRGAVLAYAAPELCGKRDIVTAAVSMAASLCFSER